MRPIVRNTLIAVGAIGVVSAAAGVNALRQPVVESSESCTVEASKKWGPIALRKVTCVETTTQVVRF